LDKKIDGLWEAVRNSNSVSSLTHEQLSILSSRVEERTAAQNTETSVMRSTLLDHESRIRTLELHQKP
jgi:hypothetical protein